MGLDKFDIPSYPMFRNFDLANCKSPPTELEVRSVENIFG
nr:MAG TPA: hypothetical protein [Caudoviricetes sp.]